MFIKEGKRKSLKKIKGWRRLKVHKKTNQWFYCPSCGSLVFFRVFKCRFNWTIEIPCECGTILQRPAEKIMEEAKKLFPHFRAKRGPAARQAYEKYLMSPHWKMIRNRVLERDVNKCQRCGDLADVVHHKSYHPDVLGGLNDSMLVSLCFSCHYFIEFDGDRKVSLEEANRRLAIRGPV
ncbi:MAG: hypothetical protein KGJ09_09720 [Candidatus Omnitrophica bacterium]|nr:hypothetical protein [Candidatus Omnitrophota bacterium]MDE2215386.1 hypothetical protein [Candidatus Omnitrophota bacterium]